MLLFGIGLLVIGVLKVISVYFCFWDLVEYGGKFFSYVLMGIVLVGVGSGYCFSGGYVFSGFVVMVLFFLFYFEWLWIVLLCWLVGVSFGMLMGFG